MKNFNSRAYLYIAGIGMILIIALTVYYAMTSVSDSESTEYIYIDDNDTQDSVIAKLQPYANPIGMAGLKTLLRHSDYKENIRTGRYAINPDDGAVAVFHRIKSGQQTTISMVVPEARTMERLAELLSKKLMIDSTTIINALKDTCNIAAMFVPNTYDMYWDVSVDELLQRMKKEHDRFWKGDREAKAAQINLTPTEVATLASIIDEETADNAEKPMIAGMYINRLRVGMPLQADPTIKFALKQFELKRIYNKLLNTDSPFNTYANQGLPPGPIKIASIRGIDAVLNHVKHDYLYMCAKADFSGSHVFAKTYKEHLKNAAEYTQELNARGIQ